MNKFIRSFLSGILIGTCMILPGVSGSVVAIMLGVYDEVIFLLGNKCISNIKKIKKLLPISIGIVIGVFIFGKVLLFFYTKFQFQMMYIFIGLILGSIPILTNEIKSKNEKFDLKCFFIALIISIILFFLPKIFDYKISNDLNSINLFVGGILYIAGKVIPGISSSFFLMQLGLYEYLLTIITNPLSITLKELISLIPFFVGVFIGLYIFIKLMNILLNNHFSKTYSCIIGFIAGSTLVLFPGAPEGVRGLISVIFMILSYIFVSKTADKT